MTHYNLDRLVYHKVLPEQVQKYREVTGSILELACRLDKVLPDSPEKTHTFRLLEQLRMQANKTIAFSHLPMFVEDAPTPLEDYWSS